MTACRWKQAVSLTLTATLVVAAVRPALAHNERIHQSMTDYAYHLALAMAEMPPPIGSGNALLNELATLQGEPGMPAFFAAAHDAVPKLRALRSGLPEDLAPCVDADLIALVDDDSDAIPDWQFLFGTLAEQAMSSLIYPVTIRYAHKNVTCEIDKGYRPIGATVLVNPAVGATPREQFRSRDHTGVTLGYWAAGPDRALKDWIFRSTTLEVLSNDFVKVSTGVGVSALAAAACAIACGLFPLLCAICPALAVGAGIAVIDAIDDLDASSMEHDDFTGLGHHLDMKALAPGDFAFDDRRGKFMERAGPAGNPDFLEEAVIALYDLLGWHVRHDLSHGPKNYETIVTGTPDADFHQDSIPRSAADWETENGAHIQYTPVDNLAMWGWTNFKALQPDADPLVAAQAAPRLGWALHAIGDVTSPMHVIGATGFGHRPYEESVDNKWEQLVFAAPATPAEENDSLRQAREIVKRALGWRQFILAWRTANGRPTEVPVRDLVTALAAQTLAKSSGQAGLFNSGASVEWQFGSEATAEAAYDSAAMTAFQRDTVIDAVAVTLAYLISATEVIP